MKKVIYKYQVEVGDQVVYMPNDAEILCAQMQHNDICLWALVEPKSPEECRQIKVIGTGHPIVEEKLIYISTVQMHGGTLIWHVFEKI